MHIETVIDFKDLGQRLRFTQPIKELIAKELNQVEAVLQAVNDYQAKGFYVVGYVSYEAASAFDSHFQVSSHRLAGEYLAYFTVHDQVQTEDFPLTYAPVDLPNQWKPNISKERYDEAIADIKSQIRQGNTYQVNYTLELSQRFKADAWKIYQRLMVEQGAGYNAYIAYDDKRILSVSPELFFKRFGNTLVTRPMKGTTARKPQFKADLEAKAWLAADFKNRAENMMIVDLLRNDMGRICRTGTVKVYKLCDVEQYRTVWQMTSTIEGELDPSTSLLQIFQALFPCGSITGAPKISTMAIINRLEERPRGIYCGTIGICLPNGRAIFNVPIRTLQMQGDQAYYGVGGGITWDSQAGDEYEETRQKSAVLTQVSPPFALITTAKVEKGQIKFYNEHLKRLKEAAQYYEYPYHQATLEDQLSKLLRNLEQETYRLKINLTKSGKFILDCQILEDLPKSFQKAILVKQEDKDSQSAFAYFKTSYRPHRQPAQQEQIYHLSDGRLTETSIGNLVLEVDGEWVTPPVSLGLLDGIYRRHLLETGKVTERVLTLADLKAATAVYACNALRGLYPLTLPKE